MEIIERRYSTADLPHTPRSLRGVRAKSVTMVGPIPRFLHNLYVRFIAIGASHIAQYARVRSR
jgi:hypothetical protein